MTFTEAALLDLIYNAAIPVAEKGRLITFVRSCFPAAEHATRGVPPALALAVLQGCLSLPAGRLLARLYL